MADYKLYLLDANGHVRFRHDLDCADDEAAIQFVQEHHPSGAMELWCGARVVASFPGSS